MSDALQTFDDLRPGTSRRLGPFTIREADVAAWERWVQKRLPQVPVHVARADLPSAVVLSFAGGELVRARGRSSLICIRHAVITTHGPVGVEQPYWLRFAVDGTEAIDEAVGCVDYTLRIEDADERPLVTTTHAVLMGRRSPPAPPAQ